MARCIQRLFSAVEPHHHSTTYDANDDETSSVYSASRMSRLSQVTSGSGGNSSVSSNTPLNSNTPSGNNNTPSGKANRRTRRMQRSIRIVDTEDFPQKLVTYFWLANGIRSFHSALCLLYKVQRVKSNVNQFEEGFNKSKETRETRQTESGKSERGKNVQTFQPGFSSVGIEVNDLERSEKEFLPFCKHGISQGGHNFQLQLTAVAEDKLMVALEGNDTIFFEVVPAAPPPPAKK